MSGGTESTMRIGENLTIAGLAVQVLFFMGFIITSVSFHHQMHKRPTSKVLDSGRTAYAWKKHLYALYGGSILILVRSVFRLVEYSQGNDGYLISHEVFLYTFDALLMFSAMVLFAVIHPSEIQTLLHREAETVVRNGDSSSQRPFYQL